jgi:hypothetical protein
MVAQKIERLLREGRAPVTMFGMGLWLLWNLTAEERQVLDAQETLLGEEGANAWLQDVMVRSGKYRADGESVERV